MDPRSKLNYALGKLPYLDNQLGKVMKTAWANCSDEENLVILKALVKIHKERWGLKSVPIEMRFNYSVELSKKGEAEKKEKAKKLRAEIDKGLDALMSMDIERA